MTSKYKELGKNTTILAISMFLSKFVSSILVPLYTHTMTTEQYGIADLVTTISHFMIPICSLSVHEAVFRFAMDREQNKKEILRCGINISWIASIVMLVVGYIVRLYEPVSEWSWYLIVISILTMERNILSLYTEADGRIVLFGIDSVICNFVLGIANVVFLACFSLGIKGFFWANITSLCASIMLLSIFGKISLLPSFRRDDSRVTKTMLMYSTPLVLNSISWILMSLVDRVMLTSIYSSSSNGIYAVSSKIPTLLTVLTSVFTQAWGLSLVKDYDTDRDDNFYNNVFDVFHLVALLGTNILLMFTNNIFTLIIGAEFSEAIKYIPILMLGTVFLTYTNFYSPIYSAVKKSSRIAISSVVGLLLNILMNALLIPSMGIMGACIATAGSYALIGIYRMVDSKKYVNFSFDKRRWIISMVLIAVQCVFATIGQYDIIASVVIFFTLVLIYKKHIARLCVIASRKYRSYKIER